MVHYIKNIHCITLKGQYFLKSDYAVYFWEK